MNLILLLNLNVCSLSSTEDQFYILCAMYFVLCFLFESSCFNVVFVVPFALCRFFLIVAVCRKSAIIDSRREELKAILYCTYIYAEFDLEVLYV